MIMATTKTAATKATAAAKSSSVESSVWGEGAEVLDGVDLLDKGELIGVPFLITGFKFTVNDRSIIICWIEAEREDHTPFTFTDTSSGVLKQIENYCALKGLPTDATGEWQNVRLIAPKGLRVSKYDVTDERGKTREAKTYYLTTSGRRA